MSLFAGIVARNSNPNIPPELALSLRRALDLRGSHALLTFERDGVFLAKIEIGAYDEPGHYQDTDGSLSAICGEPLLHRKGQPTRVGRDQDLALLHEAWKTGDHKLLRTADGVFSGVHVSADGRRVVLATDHLGIRPVYLWQGKGFFVFSSCLRWLTNLSGIRRTLDERGVLQFAAFGGSLQNRTAFQEITRLGPAEIVKIQRRGTIRSSRYWRWEEEIPSDADPSQEYDEVIYQQFRRGIRRRLGSDGKTLAFLSGGLDSRCVVSVLADLGADIHTFNFSLPGTQERVFSRRFAEQIKGHHFSSPVTKPISLWEGDWSFMFSDVWDQLSPRVESTVSRPNLVWSGDGGSVCVTGPMALTDPLVEIVTKGEHEELVEACSPDLPSGVLPSNRRSELRNLLSESLSSALASVFHDDPLRRFHLYWLFNRTRRHLDGHFEHIHQHRLEFHLPFFDKSFLESLFRVPARRLLKHQFYHRWLACFPEFTSSVPWQTYPGHLPCPIPYDPDLPDQWQEKRTKAASRLRQNSRIVRRKKLVEMLPSTAFPSGLLDRKSLLAAGLVDQLGLKDYSYVVNFAYDVFRFARAAS